MTRLAFATPELRPFSKTGGLADVSDALSAALARRGIETTVFSPCHRSAKDWLAHHAVPTHEQALPQSLRVGSHRYPLIYRVLEDGGRRLVFVVNDALYDRKNLYVDDSGRDYADSVNRFAYFCRAVLEYYVCSGEPPDIFHAHDWQSALIPVYLKALYRPRPLLDAKSVLTVHNLGYQGLFPADQIYVTGLGWDVFHPEGLEFHGRLNFLKGGVIFADAVTTVSPTYAKEIQTEEFGKGLHGVMHGQRQKLSGILNGIDTDVWNPAADPHLPAQYSVGHLEGKATCKEALQRQMGLPVRPHSFLLGVVSRFDRQKGIHLVTEVFRRLTDLDVQIAILGLGEREIEQDVRRLVETQPDRAAALLAFDESLAHRIEAGADAFLMPSAYEPCGLNQMYSQRYGTVPIVREIGGLKDTVVDFSSERMAAGTASGFSFAPFTAAALEQAVRRAADLFHSHPKTWAELMRLIMRLDHSWEESARAYVRLYEKLVTH